MTKAEIVKSVRDLFLPITLAVPDSVILQSVEEAIRWFDREGAIRAWKGFAYGGTDHITLTDDVDCVLAVYPNKVVTELFTAQTLLLGVTILDYDLETIATKFAHLSTLRTFLGSKFRWKFIKPLLYVAGMVTGVDNLVVEYFKHYDWEDEDTVVDAGALDFIKRYAVARTKIAEGRVLRMGRIIDAPMDGAELTSEGKEEIESIKNELRAVRSIGAVVRSS